MTAYVTYSGEGTPEGVELSLNGVLTDSVPWSGDAWYQLRAPAMIDIGDGTGTFNVQACMPNGGCGRGFAAITRHTPSPSRGAESISALWREGDDWKRAEYGHEFLQFYATTSFNVAEVGENTRRQLKENVVQLQWSDGHPEPSWSATVGSSGSLADTSHTAGSCATPPIYCYGNCSFGCSWFGSFGMFPSAGDTIEYLYHADKAAYMSFSGGSLHVTIP